MVVLLHLYFLPDQQNRISFHTVGQKIPWEMSHVYIRHPVTILYISDDM